MVVSVRKWLERLRFLIIFVALTYLMIYLIGLLSDWIAPVDRYREPQGKAVKVFRQEPMEDLTAATMADRLRLFYWYGE